MIGVLVMILLRHTGVSGLREETAQFQWKYQPHHHRTSKWGRQHRRHGSPLLIKNLQNSHVASEGKCHADVDYQCHWRGTLTVVEHDNDLISYSALKHMVLTLCLTYYQLCVLGERKNLCHWPCTPFQVCSHTGSSSKLHTTISWMWPCCSAMGGPHLCPVECEYEVLV